MKPHDKDPDHERVSDEGGGPAPRRVHGPRPPAPVVLHADQHILVVNKPAGVLSVHGRGTAPLLSELLIEAGLTPPDEPFRIVHRLDLGASGVIVFGRTLVAQQSLSRQFEGRAVEKVYLALARGFVTADGEIDAGIRANEDSRNASIDLKRGKPAKTVYRVIERLTGNTLLECRPETGRLHQIRVHLAHIGHPLAVDPLYGGSSALMLSSFKPDYKQSTRHEERPLIARLTLHAQRISFEHPAGGRVSYEAELAKDFRATLAQLRRA